MNRSVTQNGFTLLEMMLVVVLIAITATFVNLNLDPDPEETLARESERVAALIRHLAEESMLTGRAMALEFDPLEQRYRFLELLGREWQTIETDDLLRERGWAPPVKAKLDVSLPGFLIIDEEEVADEQPAVRKPQLPRIIVDPVGEIFPFQLTLYIGKSEFKVHLNEFHEVVAEGVEDNPEGSS